MEMLHPDVPMRPERRTQAKESGGMTLASLTDSSTFAGSAQPMIYMYT